jgi:uncharacterized protein
MPRCPICKKPLPAPPGENPKSSVEPRPRDRNPYFPFCSDRCKLIDLGRWLDGAYQIPVASSDDNEDDADQPR